MVFLKVLNFMDNPRYSKYKNKKTVNLYVDGFVRKKGLEPPRLAAPDPKSGAATNYATSAVRIFFKSRQR